MLSCLLGLMHQESQMPHECTFSDEQFGETTEMEHLAHDQSRIPRHSSGLLPGCTGCLIRSSERLSAYGKIAIHFGTELPVGAYFADQTVLNDGNLIG